MKQKKWWSLLIIIMVTIMSIGFVSCGDDDDDNTGIAGTWVDGTKTMRLGSDGSYNLTNLSVPSIPQYRKGTYSYNPQQNLFTINVVAVAGQNGAYKDTYIVQTLTETTLVLLYTYGDVEGYYTRK